MNRGPFDPSWDVFRRTIEDDLSAMEEEESAGLLAEFLESIDADFPLDTYVDQSNIEHLRRWLSTSVPDSVLVYDQEIYGTLQGYFWGNLILDIPIEYQQVFQASKAEFSLIDLFITYLRHGIGSGSQLHKAQEVLFNQKDELPGKLLYEKLKNQSRDIKNTIEEHFRVLGESAVLPVAEAVLDSISQVQVTRNVRDLLNLETGKSKPFHYSYFDFNEGEWLEAITLLSCTDSFYISNESGFQLRIPSLICSGPTILGILKPSTGQLEKGNVWEAPNHVALVLSQALYNDSGRIGFTTLNHY